MAYQQGLSGLSAASQQLDVIGNNVANANTVGFKSGTAEFAAMYAGAMSSSNTQAGLGVQVQGIDTSYSQGTISTTSNPLDMAINGQGFFQLTQNGSTVFSRNGQFNLDNNGYVVNASGAKLTGYAAGANGAILPTATPVPLQISTAPVAPVSTTKVGAQVNLNSTSSNMSAAAFDPTNATTYNYATSTNVYDTLGNAHALSMYFVKTGTNAAGENQWNVYASDDGKMLGGSSTIPYSPVGTLTFNSSGAVDTTATTLPFSLSLPLSSGAATPQAVSLDFTGSTQYGTGSSVTQMTQNGYTSGTLTNYSISNTGVISGTYSNGQTQALGQVALANFPSTAGLQSIGNNEWLQTSASGPPLVGAPNSGNLGTVQSGALEGSNVDLTTELVNLITAQRNYQANGQTIKAEDTLMQTLVSL